MATYEYPTYAFTPPPELTDNQKRQVSVVIVGAGPIGLCAAIDLAQRGVPSVVLDDDNTVSVGSRAICWAKRTLEIFDRLGVGGPILEKGVTWNTGKLFFDEEPLYTFNLADQGTQKHPAFINLQQYYVEEDLVDRAQTMPQIDLRWQSQVVAVSQDAGAAHLAVETPAGRYEIDADYVIAADGAKSTVRRALGLSFEGRVFEDHFLIADVRMKAPFPSQRWFWFDPPFNRGQSALLHMQADDIWRIDLQLGWDADADAERKPENVIPRLERMLGPDIPFELQWTSVYTFQCRRLARFRHDRVIFAGDAAHQVSPFGARGANSGIQDVDNLVWKLALVLAGDAPAALLDSYDRERIRAADENILNSTRSTDFITPKSTASQALRDATLALARDWPFARDLVNSGRLSRPHDYAGLAPLLGDDDGSPGGAGVGAVAPNIRLDRDGDGKGEWLLDRLGDRFCGLWRVPRDAADGEIQTTAARLSAAPVPVACLAVDARAANSDHTETIRDPGGHLAALYGLNPGGFVLVRPDQHICGRWRALDVDRVMAAVDRIVDRDPTMPTGARHHD